jgi:hypothetical protein
MDVQLDADGDLPGAGAFTGGVAGVVQRLRLRLSLHRGEWLLDETRGLPWGAWSQAKPPPLDEIRETIRAEVATCPGVVSVSSVSASYDQAARRVSVVADAVVKTDAGTEAIRLALGIDHGNRQPWMTLLSGGGAGIWL